MMLTVLIFSLVFAHSNLSRKDLQDYKCHVENASGISGSVRNLNIILQAPGTAATQRKLTRTQKVITLECFHLQTSVRVHVLYSEGDSSWTNRTVEKCTLQSLQVVTRAGKKPAVGHTSVLLTRHRKLFWRKYILQEKGISNCVVTAKLSQLKVYAEGLSVPHRCQRNQTSEKGTPSKKDKTTLNRQKLIITVKVYMAYILLASAASSVMLVISGIPYLSCLKTIRTRSRIPAATWVPEHDQRARFLTPFLKGREQEPLEASV